MLFLTFLRMGYPRVRSSLVSTPDIIVQVMRILSGFRLNFVNISDRCVANNVFFVYIRRFVVGCFLWLKERVSFVKCDNFSYFSFEFGAILAETVFVYERSEGLTGLL